MSERFELLVIGGGPAGLAAARGFRAAGGQGAVAIVTDEHRMPYRRPPLTKELLRGEVTEDQLAIEQEQWLVDARVALICGRAVALDAGAREVALSGGRTIGYRHCVLATGAEPRRLPVPGADDPAVLVVRTLDHVRELLWRLSGAGGEAIVIGSGFIGCEIASSLHRRGTRMTLVSDERNPNEARLGEAAGSRIAGWLREEGVRLELGAAVEAVVRDERMLEVRAGAVAVSAPVVVMAAGVAPRGELLIAGLDLEAGAVPTDANMRTALPGVLAAGDVCIAHNATAGRSLRVEHWGDALAQGEIAGRNAAGAPAAWDAVPGFWSTIGDHTLKYSAWGDGYDDCRVERAGAGGFAVWYGREDRLVGVLAHRADEQYEMGRAMIARGEPWS